MKAVFTHPLAEKDYDESVEWYAKKSLASSIRFIDEVETTFTLIAEEPDRYPKVSPRSRFREVVLLDFPFSIICEIVPSGKIRIMAVAHSRRKRGYWNRRK